MEEASNRIGELAVEVEHKMRGADMVPTVFVKGWPPQQQGQHRATLARRRSASVPPVTQQGNHRTHFKVLQNFVDSLPQSIGAARVSKFAGVKAALESNSRSLLREFFQQAELLSTATQSCRNAALRSTATFMPQSPETVLDEFQTKANSTEGVDSSFCANALASHWADFRL